MELPSSGLPLKAWMKGRSLSVELATSGSFDPIYGEEPVSYPWTVRFGLRPGALKPIGKRLGRTRLGFAFTGTNFPTDGYPRSYSNWYGPNSTTKVLRVRPFSGSVPRAGR